MESMKKRKDLLMIQNIQANPWSMEVLMSWPAPGIGSLVFIDAVTHNDSSRMNSEVYKTILSGNLQKNAPKVIGRIFITQ